MANRNWASSGKIYSMHAGPVLVDCNFLVDSTNVNGLGISSLKGPVVHAVYMHTSATPSSMNPNPVGPSGGGTGSVNLASSANFAILAYAAITGSTGAGSVVTGDIGIYPNNSTSITNFPPSVVIGTTHAADGIANQAIIDATAAFTAINALAGGATAISSDLNQTVTPGNYKEASGTFHLDCGGTLTFNGAGTYNFICSSTLVTGATVGAAPVFAFTGGATPANTFIYWAVGSSATINTAVTSAGATFYGTVIAQASVTATQAGTINGRLFALTGAVILSDTNTLSLPNGGGASGGGGIVVQLEDNYNRFITEIHAIAAPTSGTALKIDNSALTAGVAYVISTLGNASAAKWHAIGVPAGVTPAVGVSFTALSNGGSGNTLTSRVMTSALVGSNICSIELVGDPNKSIAPDPTKNQGFGAQFILQCRDYAGANVQPPDGTLISLGFLLNNSSAIAPGE